MKKTVSLIIGMLLVMLSSVCHAAEVKVDIYKSNQVSIADVQPIIDKQKNEILLSKQAYDHKDYERVSTLMKDFGEAVRKKFKAKHAKFAFMNFGMVNYINDPNAYITLNLVDWSDRAKMPKYHASPKGRYKDPAHLIKDWRAYEETALPLYISGKVKAEMSACQAFHCLGSFDYPTLKHFEPEFIAEVPKHQAELATILNHDERPLYRASAVFLLAYTKDENQLIQWLVPALDDPASVVRNNAARVFLVMASKDKTITLPIEKFTNMLHSPMLTDRNKALGVLFYLASQPRYASVIKQECGSDLMDSLKMQQPDLHVFAFQVLKQISGQQYGERDYAAWSQWLGLS